MKHHEMLAIGLVGAIVFLAIYVMSSQGSNGPRISISRITQAMGPLPSAGPGVAVDNGKA
jgi:hypothetical protein